MSPQPPSGDLDLSKNYAAHVVTERGAFDVELFAADAPLTVENFVNLARSGFYDGTTFHRIVKGFMIQGGDPNSKDPAKENSYGEGGPGYKLKAEFNNHSHDRGVISMARGPDPDSAGSQFFICLDDAPWLDGGYTVWGEVVEGMEFVDQIKQGDPNKDDGRVSNPDKIIKMQVAADVK